MSFETHDAFDSKGDASFFDPNASSNDFERILNINSDQQKPPDSNKGLCLIFNYEEFSARRNLPPRLGSHHDAQRLKHDFEELGFTVPDPYLNLTKKDTLNTLRQASEKDHTLNQYFVCCILTHGALYLERELSAYDQWIDIEDILSYFSRSACPSLEGKPKIFVIQACQGCDFEKPVRLESADCGGNRKQKDYLDFLIAESTYPGTVSFKTLNLKCDQYNNGSYFIDGFCYFLEKYSNELDLLTILMMVNYHMAVFFESRSDVELKNGKKQMPYITSRLINKVYFGKSIKPFVSDATKWFDKRLSRGNYLLKPKSYFVRSSKNVQFLSIINKKGELSSQIETVSTKLKAYIEKKNFCEERKVNLPSKQLLDQVKAFAAQDLSDVDCLICFVAAYFKNDSFYDSAGRKISKLSIVENFFGNQCGLLVGKPKIFIFLMCKSDKKRSFFPCVTADGPEIKTLPEHADVLEISIQYEETEHLVTSMEEFFKMLEDNSSVEDFLSLMTKINQTFVEKFGFYSLKTEKKLTSFDLKSTLTKMLFLP